MTSKFQITSDLFNDIDTLVTLKDMQSNIPQYDGWVTKIVDSAGELRIEAERLESDDAEWERQPSRYDNWVMVTDDYGYLVIGKEITEG